MGSRAGFGALKILHVITGLATGGAERALLNLLTGGLARRYESAVLSLGDEGSIGCWIRELGVPVHTLGMGGRLPTIGAIARLRRLVYACQPDLVQGWMYHGNLAASLAAGLAPGDPAVAWNIRQSLYSLKSEKRLTRQVVRANRVLSGGPKGVIYNSRLSRTQHEAFGFAAARGHVIPNGFDLEWLRPEQETRVAIRRELGLPQDALVVGHVARFHPMKDHASFLRAATQVARELPAARFLVVGREVSPHNPALAGIVPPDLMRRFVFTGERGDVPRLMQAMDVFCLSSWSEAFPNVLGEAMAGGVPCVATEVGDCADVVADTGIIVPPADTEALACGLREMAGKAADERRALGQAARRRVEACYGLGSVVNEYAALYETLVREK